jgi:hypothetical protein
MCGESDMSASEQNRVKRDHHCAVVESFFLWILSGENVGERTDTGLGDGVGVSVGVKL